MSQKFFWISSSEILCWGQLAFPPQGKASPTGCKCFLCQPWLSGDLWEARTGLTHGFMPALSCLAPIWSRVNASPSASQG